MTPEIRELAFKIFAVGQSNLANDGTLLPIAIILGGRSDEFIRGLSFEGEEGKRKAYSALVREAREINATAILTLNDVHIGKPEDREGYYWGKLAAEEAKEALMLAVTGPHFPTWTLTSEYSRNDGKIVFEPLIEEVGMEVSFLEGWPCRDPHIQ